MNKEQYLKQMMKGIHTSIKNKKNIKKELEAEIDSAMESGETWEQVEQRMGLPEEMAKEFMENMPDKTGKRTKIIVIGVIIAFILAATVIIISVIVSRKNNESSPYNITEIEKRTENIVKLIDQENYETVLEQYCTQMLKDSGLTSETLANARKLVIDEAGVYQNKVTMLSKTEITTPGEYLVYVVEASYDKKNIVYTLSFDKNNMLTGLYMK